MKNGVNIVKIKKDFTGIADIVINSLRIFSEFKAEYISFRKVKKLDFCRIDRLEKELFDLKDATHALFRAETAVKKEIKETDLYDLIVSSIFHEMLHLKEYIYILEKYEPSFDLIEKKMEDKSLEDFKKDFLRHSREMVGEAKLGLPLKIQGINEIVEDAIKHLGQIIKVNSFDSHMLRSIFVSRELVESIYGANGLEKLYDSIYEGGWVEGYFLVAESFSKSGFYEEAATLLRKVIARTDYLDKNHKQYKLHRDYIDRARKDLLGLEKNLAS
ncbi:MAG: hypothetical protein A2452_05600 [Candidatus Firestonebacteria bacterium RIFOXYC2_FULL_39_67]|nr:MAG: hypothetical protein A2536_10430 [Candidatus Firestonebacteria bacterium RIFOXYD2_FULL_39_29]OGF56414.1 MAG: hypothetical protein A2452_05600 [Candidatus Firestonebacteria bacterium RIFOXYC2_FULL_39_67]